MAFKVVSIIDGDTVRVTPNWSYNDLSGNIVKLRGYTTPPERDQILASGKLKHLLLNKDVELKNPDKYNPYSEALFCDVLLEGVNVASYFPEYPPPSM